MVRKGERRQISKVVLHGKMGWQDSGLVIGEGLDSTDGGCVAVIPAAPLQGESLMGSEPPFLDRASMQW